MGNCCCRHKSSSSNGSRRTNAGGHFTYIGEPAVVRDYGVNGTCDVSSDNADTGHDECRSQPTACSAADVRAFFAVEPKENIGQDEYKQPPDLVSSVGGTTERRFRLTAAEPATEGQRDNNVPTKTTTVFVQLNAAHNAPSAQCVSDAPSCTSADHGNSDDTETNRRGAIKTSHFLFSANAGCVNEAFLGDSPDKSHHVETSKGWADQTSLSASQSDDAHERKQQSPDIATFSQSEQPGANQSQRQSPPGISALTRNERLRDLTTAPVTHLVGGKNKNSSPEGNCQLRTETNSDVLTADAVSERSHQAALAQTGLAQIGVNLEYGQRTPEGARELGRPQDTERTLYPMFDDDSSSSEGVEADRDLNEIWTVGACVLSHVVVFVVVVTIKRFLPSLGLRCIHISGELT